MVDLEAADVQLSYKAMGKKLKDRQTKLRLRMLIVGPRGKNDQDGIVWGMVAQGLWETKAKVPAGDIVSILQAPGPGMFDTKDVIIDNDKTYAHADFPDGASNINGRLWDVSYELRSNSTLVVYFRGMSADIQPCEMTHYCNHYFGVKPKQAKKIEAMQVNAAGVKLWGGSYMLIVPQADDDMIRKNPPQIVGWAPPGITVEVQKITVTFYNVIRQCYNCLQY